MRFEQITPRNPEQYDVIVDSKVVAYVRLRNGILNVFDVRKDPEWRLLYTFHPARAYGEFVDTQQRDMYLDVISKKLPFSLQNS